MSSPDDYRRAAGYRRSVSPERMGLAGKPKLSGPIVAYDAYDLTDPGLLEMMRAGGSRVGVAGISVSDKMALRNSTFFRAVSLIAGSMGMLPLHLMRLKADGSREKARDHPLFNVLHRKANDFQTASQFKSYMQTCALLDGNAYALKVRSRGAVRQLVPLPRRCVRPQLSDTFELTFRYDRPSGGSVILSKDDVFHFRAPISLDGLTGVSLLDIAADTLSISHRALAATGRVLAKGTMVRGALETDKDLGDEAYGRLRESLRDSFSGADADEDFLILEEGLKAKVLTGTTKDNQLVEMRRLEAEEVSRFTGAPRPLLMFDETSWGSGIQQLGLFFVTYCLLQWFVIWEEAIWFCLLSPVEQETMYAKFNDGALLRGSLKEQAEFLKAALGPNTGFFTPNEAREYMDKNPLAGGDELPRPGTTAATIAADD
ncbi:phage portal protein [Sphingomonas abaci]|uniref:HK97 family phage portal protein n=1 Tax=Sphingomonas abaci TaxID=237611 RepID=A0A7W7AKD7_9SPHN|nr:phage portal protein [Sphingomonas abaci]MBB4618666.1 HK97 family phage portal protein [Sphingomonas abaci]